MRFPLWLRAVGIPGHENVLQAFHQHAPTYLAAHIPHVHSAVIGGVGSHAVRINSGQLPGVMANKTVSFMGRETQRTRLEGSAVTLLQISEMQTLISIVCNTIL